MDTICFSRFCFTISPKQALHLPPYKGSAFRGGFGHAFKRVVCINRNKDCKDCILKSKCVYAYIFETEPPKDAAIKRKYASAPHPFVLCPPLDTKTRFTSKEPLCFDLTLIGKAVGFLPYFIYTFDELGNMGIGKGRGKYNLDRVTQVNGQGQTAEIYNASQKTLTSPSPPLTGDVFQKNTSSVSQTKLIFHTPLRIKEKGDLVVDLTFPLFMERLLQRITVLSYFHCNGPGQADHESLLKQAENVNVKEKSLRWHDWERYSKRQDARMKLGGLLGTVTFEGDLGEFLPYLKVGEYVHVGQGTSFGLGGYEVVID
ncbi:MAG: CRISPR system precrRNA processing endoribonuclease RAMP protein Cas6 [Thermodesulfobacteriota bacterium]|nr:CRISPR system precrRNA processing endoribonuclease RAMP protein Cas6 [Thermodesulfobacteriota bacterium]